MTGICRFHHLTIGSILIADIAGVWRLNCNFISYFIIFDIGLGTIGRNLNWLACWRVDVVNLCDRIYWFDKITPCIGNLSITSTSSCFGYTTIAIAKCRWFSRAFNITYNTTSFIIFKCFWKRKLSCSFFYLSLLSLRIVSSSQRVSIIVLHDRLLEHFVACIIEPYSNPRASGRRSFDKVLLFIVRTPSHFFGSGNTKGIRLANFISPSIINMLGWQNMRLIRLIIFCKNITKQVISIGSYSRTNTIICLNDKPTRSIVHIRFSIGNNTLTSLSWS